MATLNNANIINGNTVETADILQLYTALGTGNPGDITGLVITGSLKGDVAGTSTNTNLTMTTTDGTNPATTGTWIPIAGVAVYSGAPINAAEVDVQIVFGINSPSFGVDFFITANQIAPPSSPAVSVSPSITGNVVTFEGATSDVVYQGWYK